MWMLSEEFFPLIPHRSEVEAIDSLEIVVGVVLELVYVLGKLRSLKSLLHLVEGEVKMALEVRHPLRLLVKNHQRNLDFTLDAEINEALENVFLFSAESYLPLSLIMNGLSVERGHNNN